MWIRWNNYDKSWFTWSPMTPYSGQESADMAWRLFSAFSGIILVFFTIGFLEMSLMVTPYVYITQYCSHYDKASKNCGPLRLQDNARKQTTNQRKPAPTRLQTMFQIVFTSSTKVIRFSKYLRFYLAVVLSHTKWAKLILKAYSFTKGDVLWIRLSQLIDDQVVTVNSCLVSTKNQRSSSKPNPIVSSI